MLGARAIPLSATLQASTETSASTAQHMGWALLIALTLYVCYFSHLGVIGFVGPDEPRYAWIARDMAETGDWVTPRLYGRPWFEKPVLYYWGAALSFKLFGVSEAAARLPSAISALLATLALAWLAWRTYGEECARWLLLLLPTSVGMIGFSHAAATDMPFAGMLTIAMVCAAVVLGLTKSENTPILPRTPWAALLLFGFFLGLAVLAKGPAAIILSGGAVFFWAIFTKRWRDGFRLLHPAAIASFCATALPWYILCARRNPDFFRVFIIEHNFKRYLTPEFQHIQPFWYYVPILLIAFFPWIALLFWAVYSNLLKYLRTRALHPTTLVLLIFSVFCILFFSISKSKLPGYVLPAVPALGLLLARACQLFAASFRRALRITLVAAGMVSVGLSLALLLLARLTAHHSRINEQFGTAAGLLTFLLSVPNFILFFAWRGNSGRAVRPSLVVASALPIVFAILLTGRLLPSLIPVDPSGKTIAEELAAEGIPANQAIVKNMNRGAHYSLNFYLHRETPEWDQANPGAGYLILGSKDCARIVALPYSCENPPIYLQGSQRFVYKVGLTTSLDRPGGGRQPQ